MKTKFQKREYSRTEKIEYHSRIILELTNELMERQARVNELLNEELKELGNKKFKLEKKKPRK